MTEANPTMVSGRPVDEIRAEVRAIALELAPADDVTATDDSRLVEDLAFHSLALLELAFALEDRFDLDPIEQERAQQIKTLGDISDLVVEELQAR
ncbi:phosphopantetheine-binding protein [Kribbella sp. NPDC050459]|uniref:phosphopantetheine-binding protein n=1 Tax=Kribbella sp. NPDC050459 TaxID=3155785 RepID=UPI0033C960F8